MILVPVLTTSLIHFSWKGWENVLFELGSERVKRAMETRPSTLRTKGRSFAPTSLRKYCSSWAASILPKDPPALLWIQEADVEQLESQSNAHKVMKITTKIRKQYFSLSRSLRVSYYIVTLHHTTSHIIWHYIISYDITYDITSYHIILYDITLSHMLPFFYENRKEENMGKRFSCLCNFPSPPSHHEGHIFHGSYHGLQSIS